MEKQIMMEKNALLPMGMAGAELSGELSARLSRMAAKVLAPMEWLRKYYAHVLGREVGLGQTLLLLATQCFFVPAVFAEGLPIAVRALFGAAFLGGVLACRKSFGS